MKAPKLSRIQFDGGTLSAGFLTRDRTLVLEGTATAKAKVTIFDNGVKIGTVKADKAGNWSFPTASLADGGHSFTASAKLKKDTSKPSKAFAGTVDGTPPGKAGIDLVAGSDTGSSATDNVTNDTTPTLSGTAEAGATVTIRDGGTVLGTAVANGSGQWSFTTAALAGGAHSFTATAADKAGNTGPASDPLMVTIDTTAPSAPSAPDLAAGSDTGTSSTDNVTSDTTPTFTGTAAVGSTVTLKEGSTVLGAATADGSGNWTITSSVLGEGGHTITATAMDAAGNESVASSGITVTIDTTGPAAPTGLDLAAADDTGTSDSDNLTKVLEDLTISGSGIDGLVVTLFDDADNDGVKDGGETVLGTATVSGGVFSIDVDLAEGVHHVRGFQTDAAGNAGAVSSALDITTDFSSPTVPSAPDLDAASDSGTSSTDNVTSDTTPTFSGTGVIGSTIRLKDGATVLGTGVVDGSGNWSITSSTLAEGDHTITATAIDDAGNESGFATGITVTIDTTTPSAPVITGYADDTGATGDGVTLDDTLTMRGTAEAGATIEVFDGATSLGTTAADGNGDWQFGTATLAQGAHSFTASATDAAGNTGPASAALAVRVGLDIDVATMTAADGFRIFGADTFDFAGQSVSSAGDINGDGFGDLIVGAYVGDGPTNTRTNAGEAIVIFGKAGGFADIDVATMTAAAGFRIFGADMYDQAGRSVSSAGDINGDGFDDLIVGARDGDGPTNTWNSAGEAIVVFGKAGAFTDIDVSTMTGADGFRVFGADMSDRAALSVSSAGDINGDGFDDMIVGSYYGDGPANMKGDAGEAILVFGKAGGFTDIDVSTMTAAEGFRIYGANNNHQAGRSVSSAGDINGDGFADLLVGAWRGDGPANTRTGAGEAIVVFGKAGSFTDIDVSTMIAVDGFRIFGADTYDRAGYSVSSGGDINGDGFADLIVGAIFGDGPTNNRGIAGEAIVVFGKASGFSDIDVSAMTAAEGFRIFGADASDAAGRSVSYAGDINGDGFDDLIVGAVHGGGPANTRSYSGEAIVIFGKAVGFNDVDVATMTAADGFRIFGADSVDEAGRSVSSAGDINGDGFDDLIVGAVAGDGPANTWSVAGEAIVIFGGDFLGGVVHLGGNGADTLSGTSAAETFVGGQGNDLMTGNGGADSFHGGAGDDTISLADLTFQKVDGGSGIDMINLDPTGGAADLTGATGRKIGNIEKIDLSGGHANTLVLDKLSVLGMAGSNGAAFAANTLLVKGEAGDRVSLLDGWTMGATVSDPHGETGDYVTWTNGAATLLIGEDAVVYSGAIDTATMTATEGFRIFGADAFDAAGWSVSSAGDVNGDGFEDLIVGAPGADGPTNIRGVAGEAIVIFGKAGGFTNIDVATMTAADGFRIFGSDAQDYAGRSVSSAGDINGDGFADLILGALGGDGPTNTRYGAGESIVIFGKAGSSNIDVSTMTAADGFRIFGADANDDSGRSVSYAGDINGDGFDDLVVGADRGDGPTNTRGGAGESIVIFGKAGTFSNIDVATMTAVDGFRIFGADTSDYAGRSVSSAGDINGDGFDDLIVGVLYGDGPTNTRTNAGEAIIVFGKASGLADIDVSTMTAADGFRIFGADPSDRTGVSVASGGDINGDGFDDLIIGGYFGDGPTNTRSYAGEAVIVFGKGSGLADIDVSTMTATDGFRVFGSDASDRAGRSVSSAGDVNGDGFDDLIIGAPYGDGPTNARTNAGEAIVVFGKAAGFADVDVSTMTAADGFRIFGGEGGGLAGFSVSAAGDINGDGFADLIVGARDGDGPTNTRTDAGEAIVIFGGDFLGGVVHLGGNSADALTGTSAAETFVGGQGNDLTAGNGGADSLQGGAGDDTITLGDLTFRKADGGSGTDTLAFGGTAETIDLTTIDETRIEGIEALDVIGTGNDTIVLGALDILHLSDSPHAGFTGADSHQRLVVHGDAGDALDLRDFDPGSGGAYEWSLVASGKNLDGSAGGGFDVYNLIRNASVVASVAVDADMTIL